jgi:hypothetical protein
MMATIIGNALLKFRANNTKITANKAGTQPPPAALSMRIAVNNRASIAELTRSHFCCGNRLTESKTGIDRAKMHPKTFECRLISGRRVNRESRSYIQVLKKTFLPSAPENASIERNKKTITTIKKNLPSRCEVLAHWILSRNKTGHRQNMYSKLKRQVPDLGLKQNL